MAEKPMTFSELLKARRSVFEFTDKPVSEKDLKLVLEAGRWAPSAHNTQDWKFIVVRQRRTIEELMEICYYGEYHEPPPLLIAVVAEPFLANKKALLRGEAAALSKYHKYLCLGMPVLNMTFQAAELGVGSCILSPIPEKAGKILRVPQGREVLLMVGLGHEKPGAYRRESGRKPLEEIVAYENYPALK